MAEDDADASKGENGEGKEPAQLELFETVDKLARTTAQLAEMQQQQAAKPAPEPEKPQPAAQRRYTAEEIYALVEAGQITQAQAHNYLALQMRSDAEAAARAVAQESEARSKLSARDAVIATKIGAFTKAIPALRDRTSPEWSRISARFRTLVQDEGRPADSLQTELDAIRAEFGWEPPEETVRERTRPARAVEMSGAGGGARRAPARSGAGNADPLADLEPRVQAHYEKMIRAGQYKGKDDPKLKAVLERHRAMARASA